MQPTIVVRNVSKRYQIGAGLVSLRDVFTINKDSQAKQVHWALKDVSFELHSGDALGIIGPNGAGKTTILKILSQVTQATSGKVSVNGRFSSLIELGAGFHPDLTGRENIFLNGTILGMRRSEIKSRFDTIVEFSGIEKYLDTPVKRYSSGMYARLGFSIAAHVDPDILLVDEVLAVGDMGFRAKCYKKMRQLIDGGTTLIFVSHDFSAVQKVCKRGLVLNLGQIAFDGHVGEATAQYSNILRRTASRNNNIAGTQYEGLSLSIMTQEAVIEQVQLLDADERESFSFQTGELMRVRAVVKFNTNVEAPHFACAIRNPNGEVIYDYFTHWANLETPDFPVGSIAVIEFPLRINLLAGTYHLGLNSASADLSRYYDRIDRAVDFVVTGGSGAKGIADLSADFRVIEIKENLMPETNPKQHLSDNT